MKLSIKLTTIQKILLMKVFAIMDAAMALNTGYWLFIYPIAWWDADIMTVFSNYPFIVLTFVLSVVAYIVAEVYVLRNILKVLGKVDVASPDPIETKKKSSSEKSEVITLKGGDV